MTTEKRIDRKSFLTSAVAACAAVTLGACSGESEPGDTNTGGTNTGGTPNTGGTNTGGTPNTGGTGGMNTVTGGIGSGGTATGGAGAGGSLGTGGSATGGAGGSSGGAGGDTGGTSGGGSGGGGGTFTCSTVTDNGTHSHPLVVPGSDVQRGYSDGPYTLEDGGTGHMHTVELTAYDFLYLQGGSPVTAMSTSTNAHVHPCVVTCVGA